MTNIIQFIGGFLLFFGVFSLITDIAFNIDSKDIRRRFLLGTILSAIGLMILL